MSRSSVYRMDYNADDSAAKTAFAEFQDRLGPAIATDPSGLTLQERSQIAVELGQVYAALDALQTELIAEVERRLAVGEFDTMTEAAAGEVLAARGIRIALTGIATDDPNPSPASGLPWRNVLALDPQATGIGDEPAHR